MNNQYESVNQHRPSSKIKLRPSAPHAELKGEGANRVDQHSVTEKKTRAGEIFGAIKN